MADPIDTPALVRIGLGNPDMPQLARWPAWLMSTLLHLGLLFFMIWSVRVPPRGVPVEPERTTGIVLVRKIEGRREYRDEESQLVASTVVEASRSLSLEEALPSESELSVDFSGVLPMTTDPTLAGSGAGLPDVTALGAGTGSRLSGGVLRTQVFGALGEGTRFVYVFDRSGSMNGYGGRPLQAAKSELLRSLYELESSHQFQIIFYNEAPRIFEPQGRRPRLAWGDDVSKRLAREFVQAIRATGGTEHVSALMMALKMRPDVVFFLTDADDPVLTSSELARITRLNQGVAIHTIELGVGPQTRNDNFLAQLARQNNGQHVYVDVAKMVRE